MVEGYITSASVGSEVETPNVHGESLSTTTFSICTCNSTIPPASVVKLFEPGASDILKRFAGVGSGVGSGVGELVGSADGEAVGSSEGEYVGNDVGLDVGNDVGLGVGSGVG
jgi:hypothetical protein